MVFGRRFDTITCSNQASGARTVGLAASGKLARYVHAHRDHHAARDSLAAGHEAKQPGPATALRGRQGRLALGHANDQRFELAVHNYSRHVCG